MRPLVLTSVLAFSLGLSRAASADGEPSPDRVACVAAADAGQRLRDESRLSEARERFIFCSAKSCSAAIAKQCDDWFAEIERDMPTVLFRARDDQGREVLDVRVAVDGAAVMSTIGVRPVPLNPGSHVVRFVRADGAAVEQTIVLRVAEKNRMIDGAFTRPPAGEPRKFHIPLVSAVTGGLGIAGLATGTIFAVLAKNQASSLQTSCAPYCSLADRDGVQTKIWLANGSFVVGLVALGAAVITTLLANRTDEAPRAASATAGNATFAR